MFQGKNMNTTNSCQICGKSTTMGYNKPHSLHRTKKIIRPNIQKIEGQFICTRCLRTKAKRLSSKFSI